ncbi:type I pullulanase [Fonticella tunisiensis]|uniref:Pullulanase n=1 Tax=Fonticella tunisiensis TaxID=1096341 RepID=A0A4R7KR01_9CLOT|nr:type I pullulanase [Fonticella tunisiensis]TDT61156.1 pullulanase [Fonticella tunisiensis]
MRILWASVLDFKHINVHFDHLGVDLSEIKVMNGSNYLKVDSFTIYGNYMDFTLKDEINIKDECFICLNGNCVKASYNPLYKSKTFNDRYYYDGKLGALYSRERTVFKVWSPAASSVTLLLYKNGDPSIPEEPTRIPLKETSGLWSISVNGDLKNMFYTYEVKVYGRINEAVDPYSKSCGINGLRGAIVDLLETNPDGWQQDRSPYFKNYTDAIIYEASIRDMTMHPDSGVLNKGKYLGLTEKNTASSGGVSTALSHIKELGVTHVQFMPIFDFSYKSIDEVNPHLKYNWGYDPQNCNVPEGSYSTNPYDPICRIKELKQLIYLLHKEGICVNMDVVYNHMYDSINNNFEKIFPGYYFRFNEKNELFNGSGCGNDTASEHKMMQKFIVDSVLYWAQEYHIDGFRFDLMGLHDIETMNKIRDKLNTLERPIMLYGEGWNLNTGLQDEDKATHYNSYRLPGIGFFNDSIRDSIRGGVFNASEKGFVSGRPGLESRIKVSVVGCIFYSDDIKGLYTSPVQSINYVSAHDNNTLWDKLEKCAGEFSLEDKKAMQKLSNAIVLTSQGIPFIHSGAEFCRTKYGVENSYNSPDNINWMDWNRKLEFLDVFEYYKGLIEIRKNHPAFRLSSPEAIRENVSFIDNVPPNVVAFMINGDNAGDTWKKIFVIYNGNMNSVSIPAPDGIWHLAANKNQAGNRSIKAITEGMIEVEGISMNLLFTL